MEPMMASSFPEERRAQTLDEENVLRQKRSQQSLRRCAQIKSSISIVAATRHDYAVRREPMRLRQKRDLLARRPTRIDLWDARAHSVYESWQTDRKNINPSRVDDKRTNFLTVRLVAAASSAHPTKYVQNKCAGIQDGTISWIGLGPQKWSVPNTASGTAIKTDPKVMSLSQPRAALISFRSIKTPATK